MRKSIIRNIIVTTTAVSLLMAGFPGMADGLYHNSDLKVDVIAAKATPNDLSDVHSIDSVSIGEKLAMDDNQSLAVEVVDVKVESNQVVANIDTYLNIRAEESTESEVVGKFYNGNVGTLVEQGEEWSLVSSGNAYGYVKNEYILSGVAAEEYIKNNCDQIARVNTETLNVREESSIDSDILALSGEGDSLVVVDEEGEWIKVAVSDDMIGYVASDYVCLDYAYETAITIEEENAMLAELNSSNILGTPSSNDNGDDSGDNETDDSDNGNVEGEPEDSATEEPMIYHSPAVTEAPDPTVSSSGMGQTIADFAVQFVGNPYVYGGTSLTNGADCSGFVMAVYQEFGYSLPRTSYDQANAGYEVSVSDLQPGDLIFYHSFGHVAIYIGNGEVVHASNPQTGIKISAYNYSSINRVVRVVD